MERTDNEVERVLNRAGRATAALTIVAALTLLLGVIGGVTVGGGTGAWIFISTFAAAALLYGVGMMINLLGMQLMEIWRQGRRSQPSELSD
ncbi:hypothetical protein K3N28_17845 [Glycomyces sp. TRM65418]|uniref:hypothetical protein n=1 Tax=Glycomyces sp. TRM65418 TaxID=2867006 RepID=UPI001CE50290|nr:hypothetical protein [Glycomyces sp. TRM65418]MCC3764924.1 hypothetical protein [Glycomyces sp. TRM65418]QZD54565.1 hypothetical protein K3N28_17755 [Glycomyces sp. TRM65418]